MLTLSIIGIVFLPLLVFGSSSYSFGMMLYHALFLVLTAGATIMQILNKKKYTFLLEDEKEKEKKNELITNVISELSNTNKDT